MNEQEVVAAFLDEHGLRLTPGNRVLDLASEVGELAKDVNESSEYGAEPDAVEISPGELGDAIFCVLALAAETGIDAGTALDRALAKYESRLEARDTPASGSHDS